MNTSIPDKYLSEANDSVKMLLDAYSDPYNASAASGEGLVLCCAFAKEDTSDVDRYRMISECIFIENVYGAITYLKHHKSNYDNVMAYSFECAFEYEYIVKLLEYLMFIRYNMLYDFAQHIVCI